MRFVDSDSGQQQYPQASPSGDQGELFDTGWDVHYPGPARIFLSETDIRDVLSCADVLERTLIVELLEARGWVSPAAFEAMVADALAEQARLVGERDEAIAEADGLRLSLARQVTLATGANTASAELVFDFAANGGSAA